MIYVPKFENIFCGSKSTNCRNDNHNYYDRGVQEENLSKPQPRVWRRRRKGRAPSPSPSPVDFHGHGDGGGGEGGPKSGVDGEGWMIFYVFIFPNSSSPGSTNYNEPNPSIYNFLYIWITLWSFWLFLIC